MKLLLIEDEIPAAERLKQLILESEPSAEIVDVIDSVEDAITWLQAPKEIDAVFMDIHLADGESFQIFKEVDIQVPVIFSTAYDQYAIRAFKVNGLDYLLKPVDKAELKNALDKVKRQGKNAININEAIKELKIDLQKKTYKERFLVKIGDQLNFVKVENIAYFMSEEGATFIVTKDQHRFLLDYTLDELSEILNPASFFRINRKFYIHLDAIHKMVSYKNSRLKIDLIPSANTEVIVSRERVSDFKHWLEGEN